MGKYQIKLILIVILSNIFMYLGLSSKLTKVKNLVIPLTISPDSVHLVKTKARLKIFDDFGTIISNQAYIAPNSFNSKNGNYLVEIPSNEIIKYFHLLSKRFTILPFKEEVF